MENLASKVLSASNNNRKPIELTDEELESLLRMAELIAQIEILENIPEDKNQKIEENKNQLKEIFNSKHFEGFEKHCFWFAP